MSTRMKRGIGNEGRQFFTGEIPVSVNGLEAILAGLTVDVKNIFDPDPDAQPWHNLILEHNRPEMVFSVTAEKANALGRVALLDVSYRPSGEAACRVTVCYFYDRRNLAEEAVSRLPIDTKRYELHLSGSPRDFISWFAVFAAKQNANFRGGMYGPVYHISTTEDQLQTFNLVQVLFGLNATGHVVVCANPGGSGQSLMTATVPYDQVKWWELLHEELVKLGGIIGNGQGEAQPAGQRDLPEIPSHPLKERREEVRRLKINGAARKEIGTKLRISEDIVKKDLEWLRKQQLLPKE